MSIKNVLAAAFFVSAHCLALADEPTPMKSVPESSDSEKAIIVYKVIGSEEGSTQGDTLEYRWKRLVVSGDEVEETIERLENDATIGDIEIARKIENIKPVKEIPVPSTVRGSAVGDQVYNDPRLIDQRIWDDSSETTPGRLNINRAQAIYDRSERMRIGFVDSGFAETGDITYSSGANVVTGERGPEFRENVLDPTCEYRHGTHGAHITAATTNNGKGMAGIVDADIIAARALWCTGSGFTTDVADAILWLAGEPVEGVATLSEPVDVINLSLGAITTCPRYLQDALNIARSKRILVVGAAGNENMDASNTYPTNCEGVVSVGANMLDGQKSGFSNFGELVDIYATGSSVFTTNDVEDYRYVYGTSFSAPIVSGHAALIKAAEPEADERRIIRLLTGTKNDGLTGESTQVLDKGIIDSLELAKAVSGETYVARPLSHALLNEDRPNTQAYTQPAAGLHVCNLYEVDTTKLDIDRSNKIFENEEDQIPVEDKFFKVFEVSDSARFEVANGVEVASSQGSRVLLKNIDPSVSDYGLAVCNTDNSHCGSPIPVNLNAEKAFTSVYCN
ncbi:Serine protease, subtilisin family [Marinobacter sp. es.048]|uniref:S8 family serine peptidase n=1 Tax=Marinobacter sp. es.048 TaxID=1761795 RepID=UPI000B59359A|nr:S8 family serine peptidase [Marinobacter sp. es.048]SNC74811.1 Serine protease, subtilisin family [Marinobacter sp. es.048]